MIAASVKDSEKLVELLLQRGADVNQTSMYLIDGCCAPTVGPSDHQN
jgi:hypothetical protein